MKRYICVHGHFYQPPRENAWLGSVELQDSAYPFHDWNERITAECYAPNGMSRIKDGHGNIEKITNNYAHISFNFGPTLLAWMAEHERETYQAVLDADKESQERFSGHGNAIAQAYNHAILPLCNARDKYTQVYWGMRDFEYRFGRKPEAMWLPETAVDLETLDILAGFGMSYTILSPYQAKRTRKGRRGAWRDANGAKIDPTMPYKVRLPSGRRMAVFFYDGRISQAVAFERLLDRGENLADRLTAALSSKRRRPQIVHIATDGETYGHHHKHGDMALAYALYHIEKNDSGTITNYGEYLKRHRPTHEAEIWERSAWSCAHGVGRWTRNCGCNSGSHDWNQEWRTPLREAFNWLRDKVIPRFEENGLELFSDPWEARNEYISVILNRSPSNVDKFFRDQATHELSQLEKITALKLMEMQRHAMLMYTSCGWFFDELSGIETKQVIQYAARTLQLYEDIFGEAIEPMFLDRLEKARSNIAEHKDGRVIYEKFVRPAMVDGQKVAANYGLMSLVEPCPKEARVYCYKVQLEDSERVESGHSKLVIGTLRVASEITQESDVFSFGALHLGGLPMNCRVRKHKSEEDFNAFKRELINAFNAAKVSEVIRILTRHFGESTYSLGSIFHDDQRRIVKVILQSTVSKVEAVYRQMYEEHAPMMRLVSDLGVPLPRAFSLAAQFALNSSLRAAFEDSGNLDVTRIKTLIEEARTEGVPLDGAALGFALEKTIRRLSERCLENSDNIDVLKNLDAMAGLVRSLPFEVNLWRTQNNYYQILQKHYPGRPALTIKGDAQARERMELLAALGRKLSFKVHVEAMPELHAAASGGL